jgi:PD-(D/E)XK endonuclease
MEHPKDVGDRSTLAIMLALRERGYGIYVAFGENTRCELAIDDGERLWRVQCKTGRLRHGAVVFATASTYAHHRNPRVIRRTYAGEIDLFAVYCRETGGIYLVPIEDVPTKSYATLRVEPSLNNQYRYVRFAKRYEVGKVVLPTAALVARAGGSGSSA